MPTAAISDLQIKGDDLVVATNGRSVWIFDDLTPVRDWAARRGKGPHLFAPPPAVRWVYQGEGLAGEDRIPGENPPKGALVTYYLGQKPKKDRVLEIFDDKGRLVRRLTSKKAEPEEKDTAPDAPWTIYKPTVLADEPGVHRVAWDLTWTGPTVIPKAKNDAGVPHHGPIVLPGMYALKLHVDDAVLESKLEVRLDPRLTLPPGELRQQFELAMKLRDDITRLSKAVIALRSARTQIKQRVEATKGAKADGWARQANDVVRKLDALEEQLHNPKAEVTYDILAQKGGAKLYSQLAPLYETVKESEGVVTQGMRETYAEHARELDRLLERWRDLQRSDIERLNAEARDAKAPAIVVPMSK
jgi:hypothetical protein